MMMTRRCAFKLNFKLKLKLKPTNFKMIVANLTPPCPSLSISPLHYFLSFLWLLLI